MILHDAFYKDLPNERKKFDFGLRTDGQPVYRGFARIKASTSEPVWILVFTKYNVDGTVADEFCLEGAWDNRASLFLPYV